MIQVAYDRLRAHGTLTNRFLLDTDGLNVKRSSFVCALLARLAGVEVGSTRPIVLVMVTTTVFGSTTQQGLETAEARGLTVRVLNPSRGTFHHQALCRPARRAARVRRRLGQPHKPPGRQRRGRRRPHRAARRASARAAVGAGRVVSADRTSRADRTPARRRDARGGPSSHGTPPPRARRAGRGRAATARPSAPSPAARRARSRRGLVAQMMADPERQVGADRHVAEVEEAMQVPAQRDAVRHLVRPAGRPRADVRRVDDRERVLGGDRALLPVGVEDREAEARLASASIAHLVAVGRAAARSKHSRQTRAPSPDARS